MWLYGYTNTRESFSSQREALTAETSTNHVNNTSSLADIYLRRTITQVYTGGTSRLALNQVVYEYCGGVIICLFIVDVDIKQLLLCTGGHAVFLRAAPLVSVIKDV